MLGELATPSASDEKVSSDEDMGPEARGKAKLAGILRKATLRRAGKLDPRSAEELRLETALDEQFTEERQAATSSTAAAADDATPAEDLTSYVFRDRRVPSHLLGITWQKIATRIGSSEGRGGRCGDAFVWAGASLTPLEQTENFTATVAVKTLAMQRRLSACRRRRIRPAVR